MHFGGTLGHELVILAERKLTPHRLPVGCFAVFSGSPACRIRAPRGASGGQTLAALDTAGSGQDRKSLISPLGRVEDPGLPVTCPRDAHRRKAKPDFVRSLREPCSAVHGRAQVTGDRKSVV